MKSVSPEEVEKNQNKFTKVTNLLFTQGRYLSSDAKWIHVVLAGFICQKPKKTDPSYEEIIERAEMTRTRVARALAELERFLWIKKKRDFGKSTEYTLTVPKRWCNCQKKEGKHLAEDQTSPTGLEAIRWNLKKREERTRNSKINTFFYRQKRSSN
jgi:hypothetical protein